MEEMPSQCVTACPMQLLFLRSRWLESWPTLGEARFEKLAQHYAEPHRHYHTLWHIADCLRELAEVPFVFEHEDKSALHLALWHHDAVYNPRANDNEEQSTALASTYLTEAGFSPSAVETTNTLILATKHQVLPRGLLEQTMVDVDLSILGRDTETYRRYAAAIRKEYAMYADDDYRRGRADFMSCFLQRPNLYATAFFQSKYEIQARKNLREELAFLKGKMPLEEYWRGI